MPKVLPDLSHLEIASTYQWSPNLKYCIERPMQPWQQGLPSEPRGSQASRKSTSSIMTQDSGASDKTLVDTNQGTSSAQTSPKRPSKGASGSNTGAGQASEPSERRKSSIGRAVEKAKAKVGRRPSGAEPIPDDEVDFERQKAKEAEKQKREEEYRRLGLGDQTKFGTRGGGGWNAG